MLTRAPLGLDEECALGKAAGGVGTVCSDAFGLVPEGTGSVPDCRHKALLAILSKEHQ